jgi:uncharacterized membrane protein YfcA
MLGIGTGVIIVPLLSFILPHYGIEQDLAIHIALATSMAAIATNSLSALKSHYNRGNIKWTMFKKIIFFSMGGSCIGALAASALSGHYLKNIFGIFLLFTASYMLLKKQAAELSDTIPDLSLPKLATGGFSIGLVASIIGSGGGILMVPFLHSLHLKMRYAVGTSTLIGFPVAIIGAFTYTFIGLAKIPSTVNTIGYLHWPAFLAITTAGMLCAPLGVKLSTVLPTTLLKRLFAFLITFIGLKMLVG